MLNQRVNVWYVKTFILHNGEIQPLTCWYFGKLGPIMDGIFVNNFMNSPLLAFDTKKKGMPNWDDDLCFVVFI